jgi:hypothetical protein
MAVGNPATPAFEKQFVQFGFKGIPDLEWLRRIAGPASRFAQQQARPEGRGNADLDVYREQHFDLNVRPFP